MSEEMMRRIISEVVAECLSGRTSFLPFGGMEIPVGVSGRHVHLTEEDVEALFGKGHVLTRKRDISQPGQFLCEERVTLVGPKGVLRNVAVLGPARKYTQAEVSLSDARALGVDPPVAMSGELEDAADITITSDTACIRAKKSLIVAKSHVHMAPDEAARAGVRDGDLVDIVMQTERPVTFRNMPVRSGDAHKLEIHIDFDEANACLCRSGDKAVLVKRPGACEGRPKDCGRDFVYAAGERTDASVSGSTRQMPKNQASARIEDSATGSRGMPAGESLPDNRAPDGESGKEEERYTFEACGTGSRFITEQQIKTAIQKGCQVIRIPRGAILSALARDYARQHGVRLDCGQQAAKM